MRTQTTGQTAKPRLPIPALSLPGCVALATLLHLSGCKSF